MGEVYRAHDEQLDRDVALKLLPEQLLASDEARERLLREARAAAALNHPHICTIHEVGEADGQAYIAMELVEGLPLAKVIPRGGLPRDKVLRWGAQIADALAHAHERRIVHRDLKSANIIVNPEGRCKVLDFGLAKRLRGDDPMEATTEWGGSLTQPGAVVGTLAYMAPEQLRGQSADARSDIWALGVVLFEMAAGERPFRGQTAFEVSSAVLTRAPESLPERASRELQAIVERCLQRDPAQRYQQAGEVRAALETVASGGPAQRPVSSFPRVRWRWLAAVAALALVTATLVALSAGGARQRLFGARAPEIESLAVLPLNNLSHNPEQEYFVDGMTEALIAELSKISALKVISRTSAMRFKDSDEPMPKIARALGVDGVIEGSVAREGEQVRITVQLIHGPTDRHLWAESYQRELRGILALQGEVAQAIAHEIRVAITPAEQARLASARPVNPAAYELYMLGRHHWNQRTLRGYEQAIESLRKAIELDPGYPPAYAALADAYMLQGEQGALPEQQARSLAEAAIRTALEVGGDSAETWASLGSWKFFFEWNWAEADKAFERAIELNPGDALTRARRGRTLAFLGRFEEGIRELQRARELDPLSVLVNAYLGQIYLFARRYEEAAAQFERTLELNPNHPLTRHNLGELHLARDQAEQAIPELEASAKLSEDPSGVPSSHYVAMVGCAYARAHRREDALAILDQLEQRRQQSEVSAFDLAALYTALGEKEQALDWLERGYEQRDSWFVELNAWPWFDSLRDEARFQALLQRMNLPH